MLKNLASMASLNLFKAGVQFGVSTLVALFVLPAEYGLVTFSLPIIQFIALFTDMGLASAVIRQPSLSREDAGAALAFSIAVAAVAAVLLAGSAGPVESWSGLPHLAPVLRALSLAVFFSIVAGVPRALLERTLDYQRVALIEGAGVVVAAGCCAAVVLAGGGIAAVVAFHVTLQAFRAIGFLVLTRGGYRTGARWRSVVGLLSFGGWVLATNLVNFFGRNAQNILIGAWLGATAVGLYGLSYQFMILPLMAMAWPASGVLMATLSRLQSDDLAAYRRPVLAVSSLTAVIAFPVMAFMTFGLAFPIHEFLSPHWAQVVPLLTVLAPLGALQALASYNGAVLIARGRAMLQFNVNLASSVVLLGGFLAALPFGLSAFAYTYLAVGTLVALGQIAAKLRWADVGWWDYAGALIPAVAATALGVACAAVPGLHPHNWETWLLSTAAYAAGVLVALGLARRRLASVIRDLLTARAADPQAPAAFGGSGAGPAPGLDGGGPTTV